MHWNWFRFLDRLSNDKDPKSRFTEDDVLSALHGYVKTSRPGAEIS